MTGELVRILDALEVAGVKALPFKGPALAAVAYGDLGAREFGDLDILIHPHDAKPASAILVAHGWTTKVNLAGSSAAAFMRVENGLAFRREAACGLVELHWALLPKYLALPLEGLWERAEASFPGGRRILTLSREDLLLFLCVHGAKHMWDSMRWVCDLAWLAASRPQLDWVAVAQRAKNAGFERMLHIGLNLACRLFRLELPPSVALHLERDEAANVLADSAAERLLTGAVRRGRIGEAAFHLRARECFSDKVRYGFHAAFTPSAGDFEAARLPRRLSFLYAPLRPIRLVRARAAARTK